MLDFWSLFHSRLLQFSILIVDFPMEINNSRRRTSARGCNLYIFINITLSDYFSFLWIQRADPHPFFNHGRGAILSFQSSLHFTCNLIFINKILFILILFILNIYNIFKYFQYNQNTDPLLALRITSRGSLLKYLNYDGTKTKSSNLSLRDLFIC